MCSPCPSGRRFCVRVSPLFSIRVLFRIAPPPLRQFCLRFARWSSRRVSVSLVRRFTVQLQNSTLDHSDVSLWPASTGQPLVYLDVGTCVAFNPSPNSSSVAKFDVVSVAQFVACRSVRHFFGRLRIVFRVPRQFRLWSATRSSPSRNFESILSNHSHAFGLTFD